MQIQAAQQVHFRKESQKRSVVAAAWTIIFGIYRTVKSTQQDFSSAPSIFSAPDNKEAARAIRHSQRELRVHRTLALLLLAQGRRRHSVPTWGKLFLCAGSKDISPSIYTQAQSLQRTRVPALGTSHVVKSTCKPRLNFNGGRHSL